MSKDFVFVNEKLIEFSNNINLLKYAINNECKNFMLIFYSWRRINDKGKKEIKNYSPKNNAKI